MRAFVSSSIPVPESVIANITYRPAGTVVRSRPWVSAISTSAASMVSLPPVGIASRALTARLTITCSSFPGPALTCPRPGAGTDWSSTPSPTRRRSILHPTFRGPHDYGAMADRDGRRVLPAPQGHAREAVQIAHLLGQECTLGGVDVDVRRHVPLEEPRLGVIRQDAHQRRVHSAQPA